MNYDTRLTALNLAREITPPSDAATLIANADAIQRYLLGAASQDGALSSDTTGVPLQQPEPEPVAQTQTEQPQAARTEAKPWSGSADDLRKVFDEGSTMVCKARQIGMTTFLADYAAQLTKQDKRVLWLYNGRSNLAPVQAVIAEKGNPALFFPHLLKGESQWENPSRRAYDHLKGLTFDVVIVDGMAFLPFAQEDEFVREVMKTAKHFIFASEAGEDRGLFYRYWQDNVDLAKVMLTWASPLFHRTQEQLANLAKMKEAIGNERFRNQFQCEFRQHAPE